MHGSHGFAPQPSWDGAAQLPWQQAQFQPLQCGPPHSHPPAHYYAPPQSQSQAQVHPEHIDAAKSIFEEFDRKEEDVEVLHELRRLAQERYERMRAVERPSVPKLWIKVMEAKQHEAAHRQAHANQHFSVKVESHRHTVCSELRAPTDVGRICWQEVLSLPLPEEEQNAGDQGRPSVVRVEVHGGHGEAIGSETIPLSEIRDHQKAILRTCSFATGWQLSFALQLVYSPAKLLHSHVLEFDAKLKQARSELLACEKKLHSIGGLEVVSEFVD